MKFDYGEIIKRSWKIAWKYKILWLFGFFARATSFGGSFNYQWSPKAEEEINLPPNSLEQIEKLLRENLLIIAAIITFIVFLILLFLLAKWLAKPALIKLAAEAEEASPSFSQGLSTGFKFLWRFVELGWLLWLPYIVFVIVPLLTLVVLLIFKADSLYLFLIPLMLTAFLTAILIAIPLSLLTELAHRHLVLKNTQVFQAISRGWGLLKTEWKRVGILWLINLGLSITIPLVLILLLLIALVPGIPVAIGLMIAAQSKNLTLFLSLVFLVSIGIVALITLGFLTQGLLGTFFTNYWTFAYLKLTERDSLAFPSQI